MGPTLYSEFRKKKFFFFTLTPKKRFHGIESIDYIDYIDYIDQIDYI